MATDTLWQTTWLRTPYKVGRKYAGYSCDTIEHERIFLSGRCMRMRLCEKQTKATERPYRLVVRSRWNCRLKYNCFSWGKPMKGLIWSCGCVPVSWLTTFGPNRNREVASHNPVVSTSNTAVGYHWSFQVVKSPCLTWRTFTGIRIVIDRERTHMCNLITMATPPPR